MIHNRTFVLHKPFGILSQFSDEGRRQGLGSLGLLLPKDVWPVGRLDADSEGLLLLTSDMRLRHRLMDPKAAHVKSYWVQVEGIADEEALNQLQGPMTLNIKKKRVITRPACVKRCDVPPIGERHPPIRTRQAIPTSWLEVDLTEGKNRQIRRMTAQVGLPTLRLFRCGLGGLRWSQLKLSAGECIALDHLQLEYLFVK
ncbi:MAG: pseudouridine synthase [Flavobacteriales bacterium]